MTSKSCLARLLDPKSSPNSGHRPKARVLQLVEALCLRPTQAEGKRRNSHLTSSTMSRTLIRFLGHLGGHSSSLWARSGPNSSTVALGFLLNPELGSDSTPFWGRPIFILNQFSRANLRQFRPNPAPSRLEGVQEDTKYDLTRAKTSSVNFRVIAASDYVRAVADLFRP